MSDDTANHRPLDQDPEPDDTTAAETVWDGKPASGTQITNGSPF
jgi:hypothetical protein